MKYQKLRVEQKDRQSEKLSQGVMICKFCCGGPTLLVQKEYEINTRFEG